MPCPALPCPAGVVSAGVPGHSRLVDAAVVEDEVHGCKLLACLLGLQVKLDHPLVSCRSSTGLSHRATRGCRPQDPLPGSARNRDRPCQGPSPLTTCMAPGCTPPPQTLGASDGQAAAAPSPRAGTCSFPCQPTVTTQHPFTDPTRTAPGAALTPAHGGTHPGLV